MSMVPYAGALGGRDPQAVIAETPARWAVVLDRYTTETADVPTAPGKWSVREILAHMADCEIAWSWRLRQAYGEAHSVIQPFDQDAWSRIYKAYTFAEARDLFFALRAWNVAFVRALSEVDKRKPVTHPERGQETLWTIVEVMAGHDLHHLVKLED